MEKPPSEETPQPLFGEIIIYPTPEDEGKWVHVGNTGLSLNSVETVDGVVYNIHYMPEGHNEVQPESRVKYSLVFAYAFLKLLEWLGSEEALNKFGGPVKKIKFFTNETMLNFRKHLLGSAVGSPEGEFDPDMLPGEIDVDAVRNDPGTMKRLERLAKRAESQDYRLTD
jgi:hypothetical protein